MAERTHIINFLLLSVLAGILLVSGSLQCAFACQPQGDSLNSPFSLHVLKDRIDTCHPAFEHVSTTVTCLNKACHQRLPHHSNMGGPEIYRLGKMAQPLYSSSRQPSPLYRAGSAIIIAPKSQQLEFRLLATSSNITTQTLDSIRTTVILC